MYRTLVHEEVCVYYIWSQYHNTVIEIREDETLESGEYNQYTFEILDKNEARSSWRGYLTTEEPDVDEYGDEIPPDQPFWKEARYLDPDIMLTPDSGKKIKLSTLLKRYELEL